MPSTQDLFFMRRALSLAEKAAAAGEVPVGAVLVLEDRVIAEGYNAPIAQHDPSAHAEIQVLRAGAQVLQNYRLVDTTLYVTLEPCMMCAGAIVHARVGRLVYGARDTKAGAVESRLRLLDQEFLNHRVSYEGGVMEDECGGVLSDFFRDLRSSRRS